jgi:glucose-6-phosphate 1-epimerase
MPPWTRITHAQGQLRFDAEFDRVYDVSTHTQPTWTLPDGAASLQISQSPSWGQSVVWNPGADKCAQLTDMPTQGYQRMLCVEAARVTSAIEVPPAQTWTGWQPLKLLNTMLAKRIIPCLLDVDRRPCGQRRQFC